MDPPINGKHTDAYYRDNIPLGLACKPHDNKSELTCENILPSGLPCPYSVCDSCWDFNEGNEDILPTRTSIFCFDCINNLKMWHKRDVSPSVAQACSKYDEPHAKMPSHKLSAISVTNEISRVNDDIPLVLTQKEMIDLSQLSSPTSSPIYNGGNHSQCRDNIHCAHIQPKRLFSSISKTIKRHKNVSFNVNDDISINETQSCINDSCQEDNNSINKLSSWHDHRALSSQKNSQPLALPASIRTETASFCSGYKYIDAELDQNEEELVDDNPTHITPFVRNNPYNNVAASIPLNATPYELEDTHPIFVPDWYLNTIVSNDLPEVTGKLMRKMCWITQDLHNELESYYPVADEIQIDRVTGICKRDLEAFETKCTLMFPKGRIFMSEVQLDQAAKYFLDGWNVKKIHNSKKIQCYYGTGRKNNYVSTCAPHKRRHVEPTLKEQYKCPFQISYSHIGVTKKLLKPRIFYHVKITALNPIHTCELSKQCYRNAQHSSRGKVKLSLSGMDSLLQILKVSPATPASVLRPLLKQFVNSDTPVDAIYIRNFRTRVAYYHANQQSHTNGDINVDVSLDDANHLLSNKEISPEEHKILDNPLARLNFNEMMKKSWL